MKNLIGSLFFILISFITKAQSLLNNNWVVSGRVTGLSFLPQKTTYHDSAKLYLSTSGASCISDSNGKLLFISNGFNIFDKNGVYLENGDSLADLTFYTNHNGFSYYQQSSIILPFANHKYYHIHCAFTDTQYIKCQTQNKCYFDKLYYTIIDGNLNNGFGKVTQRMIPLISDGRMRKAGMTACKHANGTDWWLIKHEGDSNTIHKFLFAQDSVYDKGIQEVANLYWGGWDIRGQSSFSQDGTLYAACSHGSSTGLIYLANFDRCWGTFSNHKVLQMPWGSQHIPQDTTILERLAVGVCFSPNKKYLYVISMSNIYQYELASDTWKYVAGLDTSYAKFTYYELAYLGADKKIYIGNAGVTSKQMSVINYPDSSDCGFCPRCLRFDSLGAKAYTATPPNMPNYDLGPITCWPLQNAAIEASNNEVKVYPNPVTSILYIETKSLAVKELYNCVGQQIIVTKENKIDMSNYTIGLYFIKVGSVVKKVILE